MNIYFIISYYSDELPVKFSTMFIIYTLSCSTMIQSVGLAES